MPMSDTGGAWLMKSVSISLVPAMILMYNHWLSRVEETFVVDVDSKVM